VESTISEFDLIEIDGWRIVGEPKGGLDRRQSIGYLDGTKLS